MVTRAHSPSQAGRDPQRMAEELVSRHIAEPVTVPVSAYLQAAQRKAQAEAAIVAAREQMRAAVVALRALPGMSDEVIARLTDSDVATIRQLARVRAHGAGRHGGGTVPPRTAAVSGRTLAGEPATP
jgi:ribosomal 50S subunit-associated protein YjgA (DUF615 family)